MVSLFPVGVGRERECNIQRPQSGKCNSLFQSPCFVSCAFGFSKGVDEECLRDTWNVAVTDDTLPADFLFSIFSVFLQTNHEPCSDCGISIGCHFAAA